MNSRIFQTISQCIACLMLPVLVCSCVSSPPAPPPKQQHPQEVVKKQQHPKPITKPYYEMDAYVKQLTIAKILLARNPYNAADIITQLETIQVFAAETQKKIIFQPVIIISYRIKGYKELRHLVVPFKMPSNSDFPALQEVLALLDSSEYITDDIHPAIICNLPERNLEFPINDPEKVKAMINKELNLLLFTKASLADLDEAKVQVHLLQFFMTNHMRDAAYLAADNAEQSLANAEKSEGETTTIENLSSQLDVLEAQLHRQMPFTINAF